MKQRKIAIALVILLCASVLLSGTLLILHTGHECHRASCPVCAALARSMEAILGLLAALMVLGLFTNPNRRCLCVSPENRFVPDWTPVRRKVKLQD